VAIALWLILGGLVGGLASGVLRSDVQQGRALNVFVGILGALLAGWLVNPLVRSDSVEAAGLSLPTLFVPMFGAALLIALVTALRRRGAR
jgi:uncharacterized membrane protein YeaQ/YmgE (transglycosylase-associated protein family)